MASIHSLQHIALAMVTAAQTYFFGKYQDMWSFSSLQRSALATTAAELGRQIEKFQVQNPAGEQARVEWFQKLLVHMDAKLTLLDGELKESQGRERGMQNKITLVSWLFSRMTTLLSCKTSFAESREIYVL